MKNNSLPDLSARELQAVCTVAESGSFMAASLTLGISQPALTRIVQRVESALGVELFRRTTRRVEVAPAGAEFVAVAYRILNDLRISVESIREIADEQRGQVIVSAVMSIAYSKLPGIVAAYRQSRSGIEIQLREGVHGNVVDDVRSGVSDIGITYVDDVPQGFEQILLGRAGFHVVMPQGHPLADSRGVTLRQAAAYPLVSLPRESQTRRLLDGLASGMGLSLKCAVTVSQFVTLMQCVRSGVGIAVIPGGAIATAFDAGLVFRPLSQPKVERKLGAIRLPDRSLTPSASGFLAQLQSNWGK